MQVSLGGLQQPGDERVVQRDLVGGAPASVFPAADDAHDAGLGVDPTDERREHGELARDAVQQRVAQLPGVGDRNEIAEEDHGAAQALVLAVQQGELVFELSEIGAAPAPSLRHRYLPEATKSVK